MSDCFPVEISNVALRYESVQRVLNPSNRGEENDGADRLAEGKINPL